MINNCPICKSPDIQEKSKDVIICLLCGNEWHLKVKSFVGITNNKNNSSSENRSTIQSKSKNEVLVTA